MNILQNAVDEVYKEFIGDLSDYKLYWYDSPQDFLEYAEIDDWNDSALFYQWYLEGMKAMKVKAEKIMQDYILLRRIWYKSWDWASYDRLWLSKEIEEYNREEWVFLDERIAEYILVKRERIFMYSDLVIDYEDRIDTFITFK